MNIGVDIDGVIADTFPLLVRELNAYFGASFSFPDIFDYNIFKVYGLSEQEVLSFLGERERVLVEEPPVKEGAVPYLRRLSKRHAIYLVSARYERYRSETEKWLLRHGVPYRDLVLLGTPDKREACARLTVDLFVEDSLKNAGQLSSCGIPVLLLDAPYNRGELPPLVRRCFSWEEIFRLIEGEAAGFLRETGGGKTKLFREG
jgi:uncharacterized HAD superfamily protein